MNVASLELCKELYELSGWAGLNDLPRTRDMLLDYFSGGIPQYTLSYLLRKLPPDDPIAGSWLTLELVGSKWFCGHTGWGDTVEADTPEDAACKLAIELFKQGVFK